MPKSTQSYQRETANVHSKVQSSTFSKSITFYLLDMNSIFHQMQMRTWDPFNTPKTYIISLDKDLGVLT